MTVSQSYAEQYKLMHSDPMMFPGEQAFYADAYIHSAIKNFNVTEVFDYGCGKGLQYTQGKLHKKWGVSVTLYDIGVNRFSIKPNRTFEMVISTDVLEHIEPEAVTSVLNEIDNYATKVVLVSIATRPAKKTLPDGRNAHLTVQPQEWWLNEILRISSKPWLVLFEKDSGIGQPRTFTPCAVNLEGHDEWFAEWKKI